jgi:hypothetical protein
VQSKTYTIDIVETPSLLSFDMVLKYPEYTKKKDEILKSTGNALVPEGTIITWKLNTKSTEAVFFYSQDTLRANSLKEGKFVLAKNCLQDYDYVISTSNDSLKDYEKLAFTVDVVLDEYPEINLKVQQDSLDLQTLYFYGQINDDYGFSKLQMVYYPSDDETNVSIQPLKISGSNIQEFVTAFPNNLNIEEGVSYHLYFQLSDNDVINNFKSVKSKVFTYRKRTKDEEAEKNLQEQGETIKDLNKSLKKFDEQEKLLEDLTKTQKEKANLSFNDKRKLESFFKRQKSQDEMMKNFNKKIKENLEEFQKENKDNDIFKEELKERLKENEERLEKDEELLRELEKLQEKINNEELIQKLDELAKQNKNKKRSLEQILELTKRFYVEKKLEKLQDDLNKLGDDQNELSKKDETENTKSKQEELNERFKEFKNEIEKLEKENENLKKPMEIPRDKLDEQEVDEDQQNASDELEKGEEQHDIDEEQEPSKDSNSESLKKAQKSQKKAAQKMKQMSKQMESMMQASGGEQLSEDLDMLRQILDNLLTFSFDQEFLMKQFQSIDVNHNKFASYLKKQSTLREHFEHIDDSLFALSLRQPKLSEQVNKEISDVYYNMDNALNLLADNQLYQGISKQQFAVTAANNLANFLSDVLDNMQESMSMSSGKGQQGDMQLPDIIMSQEELNKMMEAGMKEGKSGKPEKESDGDKPNGENKGSKGDAGENGKNGNEKGKNSNNGKAGNDGNGTNNGQEELLYQIYQQQQQLREALQERLSKEGNSAHGDALVRQMESVELELLNKGFTQETLKNMMALKHQLLKLEKATFQQGEDNRRESETNKDVFYELNNNQIINAKQYFNTTEILNRQALPLHQVYKKKVQLYFKESND